MAVLAIGAVGAAAGYAAVSAGVITGITALTAAQIGYTVFSLAASYLLAGQGGEDTHGPRVSDLKVTTTNYGIPIPEVYGAVAVAGDYDWCTDLIPVDTTTESGGKGGSGPTHTDTTYHVHCSVSACVGPGHITRIWANEYLIYDETVDPVKYDQTVTSEANLRLYDGTEDQLPDSIEEAILGAGNVPGYRGKVRVVFESLQLSQLFGNRPPTFKIEVVKEAVAAERTIDDFGGLKFDPTNELDNGWDYLHLTNDAGSANVALSSLITNSAFTILISFVVEAASANNVNPYENHCLLSDHPSAFMGLFYKNTGSQIVLQAYNWDGTADVVEQNISLNTAHVAMFRHSAGNIYLSVDGGAEVSVASGNTTTLTGNPQLGFVPGAFPHEGHIGEVLYYNVALAAPDLQDAVDYMTAKWINGATPGATFPTGGLTHHADSADTENLWVNYQAGSPYHNTTPAIGDYVGSWDDEQGNDQQWTTVIDGVDRRPRLRERTVGGGNTQYWQDVVEGVSGMVGLADYLDLPEKTAADIIDGYRISAQMTARAAIEPLQPVFYFDGVESGSTLKFVKRGGASAVTVPEDDLAAHDGGDAPPILEITRGQELELPREVAVTYIRGDGASYEQGVQYARREVVEANGIAPIEVAIVLSDEKALEVANVNLYQAWLARDRFSVAMSREYSDVEPTDVITVVKDNTSHLIRLLRGQDGGGVRMFEAVRTASDLLEQSFTAPGNLVPDTYSPEAITDSTLVLLDLPMLRDEDDDSGFYAAVTTDATMWGGAILYKSVDGGTSYSAVETFLSRATTGTAGALPDFTGGNVFDEVSTVSVELINGELSSTTELGALNGINTAAIGIDGRWEVITFKTATLTAPLTYTLSSLLRGRLGTEWAIPTHEAGDTFVLLNGALKRIPDSLAQIGLDRTYKIVTSGQVIADVDPVTFSNDAVALKPYAPVQLAGERDGGNDLTLTWVRRTRAHWDSLDAREAPLLEEAESYEIDVLDGGSPAVVLRTITATDETAIYTAAQQTTDGLTPGDPVTVRVYQISATVGRGTALEGTV